MGQEKNQTIPVPGSIRFVATVKALEAAVSHLKTRTEMAVDVEADSMFHFREKVCLIQIATTDTVFIIDPLSMNTLSSIEPLFKSQKIRKIFHGADYDVRSLYRDFGIDIHNLFDTELASRFLGLKETGLEALLAERFDVQLDKRFQRKDWSRRPLPEEMVTYAAGDVRYLIALAGQLEAELRERRRLSWVQEECFHLSRVRPASNNDHPLFTTVKGAGRLRPEKLAVLESLLKLRRRIAEEKDRPLFKVLSSRSLLKIAVESPKTPEALEASGALSKKQIKMYGDPVLEAIHAGLAVSKNKLPVYPRKPTPHLPPTVPKRVQALKAWRDRKAEALNMDPGLVINNALIQAIAIERPLHVEALDNISELRLWRKRAFGQSIVQIIRAQN